MMQATSLQEAKWNDHCKGSTLHTPLQETSDHCKGSALHEPEEGAVVKVKSVAELLSDVFPGSEWVTPDVLEAISGKLARVLGREQNLNLRVALRDEMSVGGTPLRVPVRGTKELVLPAAAFQKLSPAEQETMAAHHPKHSFSSILNMRQSVAALALQRVLRRHLMERRLIRRRTVKGILRLAESTTGEALAISLNR
jgi:hypothetical protein